MPDLRSDFYSVSRREMLCGLGALGAGAMLPRFLSATQAATATVSTSPAGVIGAGFAGLSYEKSQMANPFFSPQNAAAIGLFKLISPGLLRVGGNSVDKTTWTPNGAGRTSGRCRRGSSRHPTNSVTIDVR